jgi:signal transduction histidine kinase
MPWWAGRLGAGFVTAIFIATVATPVFFMSRESAIQQDIQSHVVPTYLRTAQIQSRLDQQLLGIIGFQAKGQLRSVDLYNDERNQVLASVKELAALTTGIGGDTQDRWKDVETTIANWNATVDQEAFFKHLMDPAQFSQELLQSEYVLQEAHQSLADFQFAVQAALESRRERIAGIQRQNSLLSSFLAVMAFLSLLLVWKLAKRLRDAQTQLVTAVEAQKSLVIEAESRRAMAESALRSRDDILSIVSHDLRSPLNNIALTISMLRNTSGFVTEDTKRLLDLIKRGTDLMNSLIRNLVEIGRLEAGQAIALDVTEFTADSLVQDACEFARLPSVQKKIVISCETTDPSLRIHADRERLLQVLNNLIDNAIKFTPPGGAVTVRSDRTPSEVHFSVADTGIGIGEEHLSLIFERYWQVPGGKRGTGLGLAIAKRIVERHGGKIWAESQVGKGTTFHFVLPRVASARNDLS